MKIERLTLSEFDSLGLRPSNVFGTSDFLQLNAHKAENVMAFTADRRIGVTMGVADGVWRAPWSAPYLTVSLGTGAEGKTLLDTAALFGRELRDLLTADTPVRLTAPPVIYDSPENAFFEGFGRPGDTIITDTSFYINLKESEGESTWNKSARRNLKKAVTAGLRLIKVDDFEACYNLISTHHAALGYKMAMSADEVRRTARIVPVDFWMVFDGNVPLAAMYCYRVRHNTVQVISSGDTPAGRSVGAAVFLERGIIDYYRRELVERQGIEDALLDHGPTSVMGVQNEGLAAFKTSFGCKMSPKLTLLTGHAT